MENVYINNSPLRSGVKHFVGDKQIKNIYYRHGVSGNYKLVYQYDNLPPAINFFSATTGYSATADYSLAGNISDAHSGVLNATYKLNDEASKSFTLSDGGSFSTVLTLKNGTNEITVSAVDKAGNVNTKKFSIIYDTAGHTEPLSTTFVKNISKSHTHSHNHGTDWFEGLDENKTFYIVSETRGTYTGEGLEATATATYSCTIDISSFPNYQYIKRVVVGRYGYGAATVNIAEGQTSFSITDYDHSSDSNSYFPAGPGSRSRWGVKAKAGISSVTYYYT